MDRFNPAPTKVRWRVVGLLAGLCFISHLNRLAISVAGTERIIHQFHLDPTQMGRVYSAYLAVYTAGMVLGGWFIDRFGPRAMLAVMGLGSAVFGAMTGALGFGLVASVHLLGALIVVRGMMGLFTTPLHPACARTVAAWIPTARVSWANGLVTFGAVLGMASTYPLFGALMDWLDWPAAFLVSAGALFLLAAVWLFYARDHPAQHPSVNKGESRLIEGRTETETAASRPSQSHEAGRLLSPSLALLTLSYAAVGYFQYLFFYWSEYYFTGVIHLSIQQSRNATTFLVLGLGLGMPLGGYLADRAQRRFPGRTGRALVPGLSMGLSAGFLFVGLAIHSPFWMVTFFALTMAALGMSESSFWQTAVEIGRRRGALAASIINTGGNGIGLLAPLLTPWISQQFGWRIGIGLGGVVCFLGALCWLGIDPSPGRRPVAFPTRPQAGSF
jgi:MFS transporter, ACS family, D-galactonate transporter